MTSKTCSKAHFNSFVNFLLPVVPLFAKMTPLLLSRTHRRPDAPTSESSPLMYRRSIFLRPAASKLECGNPCALQYTCKHCNTRQ